MSRRRRRCIAGRRNERRQSLTIAAVVGLALRAVRLSAGMSQREFAGECDLHPSSLARLEVDAGGARFDTVLGLLESTWFALTPTPGAMAPTADAVLSETALVLADDRQRRTMALRAQAARLGVGPTTLTRGERDPGSLTLRLVARLLDACGAPLCLVVRQTGEPIGPDDWDDSALAARARGGARRLAGHRLARTDDLGPWWWREHAQHHDPGKPPTWETIDPRVARPAARRGGRPTLARRGHRHLVGHPALAEPAPIPGAGWARLAVRSRRGRLGTLQQPVCRSGVRRALSRGPREPRCPVRRGNRPASPAHRPPRPACVP